MDQAPDSTNELASSLPPKNPQKRQKHLAKIAAQTKKKRLSSAGHPSLGHTPTFGGLVAGTIIACQKHTYSRGNCDTTTATNLQRKRKRRLTAAACCAFIRSFLRSRSLRSDSVCEVWLACTTLPAQASPTGHPGRPSLAYPSDSSEKYVRLLFFFSSNFMVSLIPFFFVTAHRKFAIKLLFLKLILSLILVPSPLGVCESFFLVWGFGGLTMASEFVPETLA